VTSFEDISAKPIRISCYWYHAVVARQEREQVRIELFLVRFQQTDNGK
jgi:hypothetical protein